MKKNLSLLCVVTLAFRNRWLVGTPNFQTPETKRGLEDLNPRVITDLADFKTALFNRT